MDGDTADLVSGFQRKPFVNEFLDDVAFGFVKLVDGILQGSPVDGWW